MSTDSRSFPKSIQAHTASTTPHTISKDGITNASSDQSLFRLQQLSRDLLGLNQAHAPSTTFHAIKRDDVLIDQSYSILKDSTTRLSRGSHSSEEGHVAHERRINDLVEARWIEDKDRKERMKQELRRARDAIKSYSANVPEAPLVSSSSSSSNRSSHRGSVVVERSDNLVAKLKAPRIKGEESPNQGSYSNVTAVSMDDTSQSGKRARPNPNNFRGESKATSHREVVSASVNDSSHDAYHVSSSMNYSPARSPTYRLALPSMNDHSPARYGSQLNAWRLLSEPGPITTQVISRFQIAGDDTQGQQHTLSKLDQSVELDAPRQNPLAYELSQTTHDTSPEVQEPRLCGIKCLDAEANLQQLSDKIKELELEVRRLRSSGPKPDGVAQHPIKVQVFHRLPADGVGAYLSSPSWQLHGGTRDLKATFFIPDPERYVERVGDVTYIIYNNYTLEHQREDLDERARSNVPLPEPQPSHYQIQLVSKEMVEEMGAFLDALPNCRLSFPGIDEVGLMDGPFTWWYHCRKSYDPATLEPGKARLVSHLIASIEQIEGRLYQRIGTQFSSGKVSHWSLQYLIKPGTVLVYEKGSIIRGCLATSCSLSSEQSSDTISLTVQTRSIAFDGAFYEKLHTYTIKVPKEGEVEIASLEVYPLEHAEPGQRERLFRRGSTFWRCRKERLVSCFDHKSSQDGERFMVDFKTYKELHPNNSYIRPFTIDGRDHEKPRLPVDDCDPDEPEIFLFPAVIPGFNFRRKKWEEIEVDNIRDVVWNDKAFSHLVADEDMKDLIEALVSKQMQAEVSTDLIKNKGNGLIMLLHGSPGTGKTFTAESVAELARKPLYPVTCGDIGTEPEKVENYLNLIFSLGKKWNCVMLLDEAEVFLEQRTLQDLRRNALVSVFLRALEYYDGILILTTNRVGTFDEAFKSRIQISIPYKRLDTAQRKQIWRNFLRRLEQLEQHESIDFDDIDAHLDDLAAYTMNGRQIRNAMTTARQLAEFKKKKMNFASLKKTIGVSEKFDKYLADVREGDVREFLQHGKDGQRSDDLVARENELR